MAVKAHDGCLIEGDENAEQFPRTADTVVEIYINGK
jgi:hypothetical protein